MREIIIDCFAGGGGASVGIEMALGREVDIAINHDAKAILMHKTNHPSTLHLTEDIFKVDLKRYIRGQKVSLMWASPDCTSHSKAKGGKPRESGLRILPWAVYRHARDILPEVVIMENVEEIQQWGPLDKDGYPIRERKGEEYQRFISKMKALGYEFDSRELIAADYGAPTTRKRWYAIFRRDGKEIVWPEQTHSKTGESGFKKWVMVSSVLDFSDLGKSIFGRKKPLAENTLKRIARGIKKFVLENQEPFIIQVNHGGDAFRGQDIHTPMPTITQRHGFGIVNVVTSPLIDKSYGGNYKGSGSGVNESLHTITTSPGHFGQVSVQMIEVEILKKAGISEEVAEKCTHVSQFLMEYYGSGTGQELSKPLHTVVTKDRFALITVLGNQYAIMDIYLRMLNPEELKLAQGFPKDYIIDRDYNFRAYPKSEQVKRIGNSVVPIMAKVLVEANCGYLKVGERSKCISIDYGKEQVEMAI